jgi:hypothetical protein
MKNRESGNVSEKSENSNSRNSKKDQNIVNQQDQKNLVNPQQQLHEQDQPSGDFVSEREMSRESQEAPDANPREPGTSRSDEKNKGTSAKNSKEKFQK